MTIVILKYLYLVVFHEVLFKERSYLFLTLMFQKFYIINLYYLQMILTCFAVIMI